MRRLTALVFGLVVALASSVTSASAETFENPQGNFNWKVYDYNPSDQALRVRQPFFVREPDGAIAFNFLYEPDTALFMTGHPSYRGDLLGDMRGKNPRPPCVSLSSPLTRRTESRMASASRRCMVCRQRN